MTISAPRTPPHSDAAERVFLSPRVVDRTAFEEFTGQLRELAERADRRAQELDSASTRAQALLRELASPKAEPGAALAALEGRIAAIEARLGPGATPTADRVAGTPAPQEADTVDRLEARIRVELGAFEARCGALRVELETLARRADDARAALAGSVLEAAALATRLAGPADPRIVATGPPPSDGGARTGAPAPAMPKPRARARAKPAG